MTSATTLPAIPEYEDAVPYNLYVQEFNKAINLGVWEQCAGAANSNPPKQTRMPHWVLWSHPGTGDYEITLIQYGGNSNSLIVVDFGEPMSEFPKEHQGVIELLRDNGRHMLADKLITMLRNVSEDPDEPEINIVSLRDMARLLIENATFTDPFIGPDRLGIVHAQWRIIGNGVLLMGFLGYGEILLVAQADEGPDNEELDISTRAPEKEILEVFAHLVPRRY